MEARHRSSRGGERRSGADKSSSSTKTTVKPVKKRNGLRQRPGRPEPVLKESDDAGGCFDCPSCDECMHAWTDIANECPAVFICLSVLCGITLLVLFGVLISIYRFEEVKTSEHEHYRMKVAISNWNENCYEACLRVDGHCDLGAFHLINNCESLREAFPEEASQKAPCRRVSGHDMPTYDRFFKSFHISEVLSPHRPSCGWKHTNTRRLCPCQPRDPDAVSRPVHVVFNAESGSYMNWQAQYGYHWFKQANWKSAKYTRLLTGKKLDKLSESVPTHLAPAYNYKRDNYKPYNKPLSVIHWLKHAPPKEDIIAIVDPDCLFLAPLRMQEIVRPGSPIAMKAFYSFEHGSRDRQIIDRYSMLTGKLCDDPDPIAVPVIIHKSDLQKLAPLWLKWAEVIRSDADGWDPNWVKMPGINWVAEMFGYVLAACELHLKHDIWPDLQTIPGMNWTSPLAPIIHYHTPVYIDGMKWVKYPSDSHTNFPWPLSRVKNHIDRKLFEKMHNASRTFHNLPPDDFVWKGTQQQFRNSHVAK